MARPQPVVLLVEDEPAHLDLTQQVQTMCKA